VVENRPIMSAEYPLPRLAKFAHTQQLHGLSAITELLGRKPHPQTWLLNRAQLQVRSIFICSSITACYLVWSQVGSESVSYASESIWLAMHQTNAHKPHSADVIHSHHALIIAQNQCPPHLSPPPVYTFLLYSQQHGTGSTNNSLPLYRQQVAQLSQRDRAAGPV